MIATERFEQVGVTSAAEWRAWLDVNHGRPESVWVVTFLKADPARYVSRFALLDEALCFGWIDGLRRKLDDARTMQLFSPRRHQRWTATYRTRVERLIGEERIAAPGMSAVARAKRDGTWIAMPDVDALMIPDDLRDALGDRSAASANFDAFSASSRRNMLRWLASAKTAGTRSARVEKIALLAAQNEKVPLM